MFKATSLFAVLLFSFIVGTSAVDLCAQGVVHIGTANFNQHVNGNPGGTYSLGDFLESKDRVEILNGTTQTATVTVVSKIDGGMTQTIGPFSVLPNAQHKETLNRNLTASHSTQHVISVDVTATVPMGTGSSANIAHIYTKNP